MACSVEQNASTLPLRSNAQTVPLLRHVKLYTFELGREDMYNHTAVAEFDHGVSIVKDLIFLNHSPIQKFVSHSILVTIHMFVISVHLCLPRCYRIRNRASWFYCHSSIFANTEIIQGAIHMSDGGKDFARLTSMPAPVFLHRELYNTRPPRFSLQILTSA